MNPNLKLDNGSEAEIARILMGEHPAFATGREAPLSEAVFDGGALWRPDENGVWQRIDDAHVTRLVMGFDGMMKPSQNGGETPLKVSASFCDGVRRLVDASCSRPAFFSEAPRGVAFRAQFLRIDATGTTALEALTPAHRCRFALDFEYRDDLLPPRVFLAFLASLWGQPDGTFDAAGAEQVMLLLEWLGYLLSGRTDLQKILLMIGPVRAGKGTILRLIQQIFGRAAAAPFKLARLGDRFAASDLVGKTVAYDADVRRTALTAGNESQALETMLSIAGEDAISIERKYHDGTHARLGTRLMLSTNPPFRMSDSGGALSTRLLILEMTRSYLGSEDVDLEAKLTAEIPAIVGLAVRALQGMMRRPGGRFVEPRSSAATRKSIEQAETPLLAFIEERCELDAKAESPCRTLYTEYGVWCDDTGHRRMSDTMFAETLKRLGVTKHRARTGEARQRLYAGIRLLPGEPGRAALSPGRKHAQPALN